ncbi:MAG TPA: glycosyltransferase family 4 protein [Methanobacterium sp.]|nr:glycosyltransferase family 4 protein [Methanobacterium sp.]
MKIAFIYDAVYPFVTGGAEKRVYELAKRLVQRGHEVHWYGIGWWWPEEGQKDIELDGIKLHGVSKPMDLYNTERRSIKEAILFSIKLFPYIMRERYDIVDCQGFPFFSSFVAKIHSLLGKSVFCITWIEVWNDYWYEYLGKIGIFGKIVEKLTSYLTKNIIAISEKTRRDLEGMGVTKEIEVVPVGINMNYIEEISPSDYKSDIIFAGRLIKDKNVDILIKAVDIVKKEIQDINCTIIGEGPERANLENLVRKLEIADNIKFIGFCREHEEMISHMKSSKVFVLPSTREGFGIVIIEANACGLPVIVVNHGMNAACDLIINNKNGFIADFSKEDIALKIISLLNKKGEMRDDCIDMSKKFDWEQIVDSLEKFYMNAI